MMTKLAYRTRNNRGGALIRRSEKVQQKSVWKETLTAEPVAEAVFALHFAAAREGFPPVVLTEGVESPAAVVEVGFPLPALAPCDITTQLPKPAPEINCYESQHISKQTTPTQLGTDCKTLITTGSSSTACPRRELNCDGHRFSSWRRLAIEKQK